MLKVIFSNKDISQNSEYYACVCDLLENKDVTDLDKHPHHLGASRFQHSLNVSYFNFLLCKFFRLNAKSAARAGLLHDMFFYERKNHTKIQNRHPVEHSNIAFYNASMRFPINDLEADMILNHMWPLTPHLPRHAETVIITITDKFCAVSEIGCYLCKALKDKIVCKTKTAVKNNGGHSSEKSAL